MKPDQSTQTYVNESETSSPTRAKSAHSCSADVLTQLRSRRRREKDPTVQEQIWTLRGMLETGATPEAIARQVKVMSGTYTI